MGPSQRNLLLLGCAILAIIGAWMGYRLIRPELGPERVAHDPLKGPREGAAPAAPTSPPNLSPASIRCRLVLPPGLPPRPKVMAWWDGKTAEALLLEGLLTLQVPAGTGRASFHVAGCVVVEREVSTTPGAVVDWGTLTLVAATPLVGSVMDAAGRPVAACVFPKVGQAAVPVACTDEVGGFAFDGLPYGDAELRVEGKGFVTRTEHYRFVAGAKPAQLTVVRGGGVRGAVIDASGHAAPKAVYVEFVARDDPDAVDRTGFAHLDDDGRFEIRLLPGRYRARATLDAQEATADIEVIDAESRELTLRLRSP